MGRSFVFIILSLISFSSLANFGFVEGAVQTFNIASETKSFLIQAVQGPMNNKVFISELISPAGEKLIDSNFTTAQHLGLPAYLLNEIHSPLRATMVVSQQASLIVKKGDVVSQIQGGWSVRFASYSMDQDLKVKVTQSKNNSSRNLNFQVFYKKNSENFNHESLNSLTQKVTHFYKQYGVDISFTLKEKELPDYSDTKMEDWLAGSISEANGFRPIFIVDTKVVGDHSALSNCLPGFEAEDGESRCPLAMSLTKPGEVSMNKSVKVLAHEIGHYLGLFHTCDDFGFTEVCDGFDDSHDGPESNNLMNTGSMSPNHFELSPKQVAKVKSHPLLFKD